LIASGRKYMTNNQPDSALNEFSKALEVSPQDTFALEYSINVLMSQKKYDSALTFIDRGRKFYPTDPYFVKQRATVYENLQKWDEAWANADTLSKMSGLDPKYVDYANYLYSKRLKNELGVMFLRSYIDSSTASSIATLQFSHRYKRGNYAIRMNYAGRSVGAGAQFEGEATYTHSKNWYSFGVAAYSPEKLIFPSERFGYSLFHNLGKGWDAEIGGRYLNTYNGTMISGVASLSKEINDFYINLRGYYINLQHNDTLFNLQPNGKLTGEFDNSTSVYYSGVLTTRYFINPLNRAEFLTIILGYGTAPDDFSRLYNITRLLSYSTASAGVGYQKQVFYRTTLGIYGTWYNYEVAQGNYRNQYDVYLTLMRKF